VLLNDPGNTHRPYTSGIEHTPVELVLKILLTNLPLATAVATVPPSLAVLSVAVLREPIKAALAKLPLVADANVANDWAPQNGTVVLMTPVGVAVMELYTPLTDAALVMAPVTNVEKLPPVNSTVAVAVAPEYVAVPLIAETGPVVKIPL
jgi:hypothetical protein